jgi:hypothetical protein
LHYVRREPLGGAGGVQLLRALVCERLDHALSVTRHVTYCKRNLADVRLTSRRFSRRRALRDECT